MRTLILDETWRPVAVVTWQRAMYLLVTGKAQPVHEYDDVRIRSAREEFKLPSILRMLARHKRKKSVTFNRLSVFARDNFQCSYCGIHCSPKKMTIDHVLPLSRGGQNRWTNVVAACGACNNKKGNKTPKEAGMNLRVKPHRPKWSPGLVLKLRTNDPLDIWEPWLEKSLKPIGES